MDAFLLWCGACSVDVVTGHPIAGAPDAPSAGGGRRDRRQSSV
ncbi:hypothetical protein [Agreia sp. Leaf210]|nr:hypothetical protein [Agreia sp. Leaf210]